LAVEDVGGAEALVPAEGVLLCAALAAPGAAGVVGDVVVGPLPDAVEVVGAAPGAVLPVELGVLPLAVPLLDVVEDGVDPVGLVAVLP
jgi:hypothetical protein